jgi:hypothetical protein
MSATKPGTGTADRAPATRWTASALVALTGSDLLQVAYDKTEETL